MKTTVEIKRENLKFVIDRYHDGVTRKLALALGKPEGALSRYFSESASSRGIGKMLARQIERLHNLPEDWMITDHSPEANNISAEEVMLLERYRKSSDIQRKSAISALRSEEEVN